MDCLGLLVMLIKIPPILIGMTVLAVGNVLPDAILTNALAKAGQPRTAIAGLYAAQLFALLLGFGLAQLKNTLQKGEEPFPFV